MNKENNELVFLIMSLTPWDYEIGNNSKDLAYQFSKYYQTIYINIPTKRREYYTSNSDSIKTRRLIIKGKSNTTEKINQNLSVFTPPIIIESINWIRVRVLFTILNYINNIKYANSIKKLLRKKNITRFIIINDNDVYNGFYLKRLLNPALYIYYLRDNLSAINYWKFHVSKLEPKLISRSDIVLCNSLQLQEYAIQNNSDSYFIGQGCDVELFCNTDNDIPIEELSNINRPIIGYAGACLSIRLDINLLENIAIEKHEWSFVFVGPEDADFKSSKLHSLPNVVFTGPVNLSILPAYIAKFDVCINPQLVNELTIGNYPRKIDEYLCLGKPIVATYTKAMDIFKDYVYLAKNKNEFVDKISGALNEISSENINMRIKFAENHSWETNAQNILAIIEPEL